MKGVSSNSNKLKHHGSRMDMMCMTSVKVNGAIINSQVTAHCVVVKYLPIVGIMGSLMVV